VATGPGYGLIRSDLDPAIEFTGLFEKTHVGPNLEDGSRELPAAGSSNARLTPGVAQKPGFSREIAAVDCFYGF